jgi:hypothetical protein
MFSRVLVAIMIAELDQKKAELNQKKVELELKKKRWFL